MYSGTKLTPYEKNDVAVISIGAFFEEGLSRLSPKLEATYLINVSVRT